MNSRLKKLLLPLLRGYVAGKPRTFRAMESARQALFLIGKGIKKPSQGRLRRVSKRYTKNEETAKIREAVFRRAGDHCEAGRCRLMASELDHWFSGSGRRMVKQSVETCWALCAEDHRFRTRNAPSAEFWNILFREHCERHGYGFTPHIPHEPIARRAERPWRVENVLSWVAVGLIPGAIAALWGLFGLWRERASRAREGS